MSNNFLDKHLEVIFNQDESFLVLLSEVHILHLGLALEHSFVLLIR